MLMFSSSDVANVLLLLFDEISQATSLFLAGKPHRLPGADTRKYAVSNQRRTRFCCYTASRTVKFTMITIYPLFYLCSAIVSHGCFCSRSCTLAPYLTTLNHRSVLVGDSNTLVRSSSSCSLAPGSKKRRPSPKRTGTMPIWISSTSPARRHC